MFDLKLTIIIKLCTISNKIATHIKRSLTKSDVSLKNNIRTPYALDSSEKCLVFYASR